MADALCTGPVGPWVHAHLGLLRAAGIGLAVLGFVLLDRPTGLDVLLLALGLGLVLAVIEFLDQAPEPAVAPDMSTAGVPTLHLVLCPSAAALWTGWLHRCHGRGRSRSQTACFAPTVEARRPSPARSGESRPEPQPTREVGELVAEHLVASSLDVGDLRQPVSRAIASATVNVVAALLSRHALSVGDVSVAPAQRQLQCRGLLEERCPRLAPAGDQCSP